MTARPEASVRYVTMLAVGAAVGGLLFGGDTSTLNGAIKGFRATLELDSFATGFVTAIALIGCAVGAWFAGPLTRRLERTGVMLAGAASIFIGSLGASLCQTTALLAASRFVAGLGIGGLSAVVPPYIAEISPKAIRGRLGSLWQLALVIGQVLGLLGSFALTLSAGSESAPMPWGGAAWRWMFATVAAVALIYAVVTRRLPSTPRELVRRRRHDRARALLEAFGERQVDAAIAEIELSLAKEAREARGLRSLRGSRLGLLPVVWAGVGLAAFQQLVGINIFKTYSTSLWQAVGLSTASSFLTSIITVVVSLVATVVTILVVDKVGRRAMLVLGAAFMTAALAVMSWAFSSTHAVGDAVSLPHVAGVAAFWAMMLYALAFGVTWGPVMWVMLSELFDDDIRTAALAVCVAVNWLTNWLVTRTFPLLADVGIGFAFGLYTAFAALSLPFVIYVLPETKDRSVT